MSGRQNKKQYKRGFLILLVALFILSCGVLAVKERWRFPLVNTVVEAVILPFDEGVLYVHDAIADWQENSRSKDSLQQENKELKKEIYRLQGTEYRQAVLLAENRQLREMLDYRNENPEQKLLSARVVAMNPGDLHDSYYLDKGEKDGIHKDMVVVSHNGMAGIVEKVFSSYSKVLLITSSQSRIGARVLRSDSRAVGVAVGQGSGRVPVRMEYLDINADINADDYICTSGIGGKYPEGIFIGRVKKVETLPGGLQKRADIEPAVDVEALDRVFVVTGIDESRRLIEKAGRKAGEQA